MAKRPYEISLWTHNDRFLSTLLTSEASIDGEGFEPHFYDGITGEKKLSFTMPIKYLNRDTNELVNNEKWYDELRKTHVLANEKKVKLIFDKYKRDYNNKYIHEIHEFIIEDIQEERNGLELFCRVECVGQAFKELGKTGTELLLNLETMLLEEEKTGVHQVPTLNYWADKVFPPATSLYASVWTYEINIANNIGMPTNKIYEKDLIVDWDSSSGTMRPIYAPAPIEKERFIDVENSNKYNITQDLAEAFQVFVRYEYRYENNDEPFKPTKKVAVFYDNFVQNTEYSIAYGNNELGLTRVSNSADVVTKMFVDTIENQNTDDGLISISKAQSSKTKDDFILNFDYFINSGQLTQSQTNAIPVFERDLRILNINIENTAEELASAGYDKIILEADISSLKNKYNSANDNVINIEEKLLGFDNTQYNYEVWDKGVLNTAKGEGVTKSASFRRQGVIGSSVSVTRTNGVVIPANTYTLQYDNYRYVTAITFQESSGLADGTLIRLTYKYDLLSFYRNELSTYTTIRDSVNQTLQMKRSQLTTLNSVIEDLTDELKDLQDSKRELVNTFNERMAPFLKEGTWSKPDYQPSYQNKSLSSVPLCYDPNPLTGESTAHYMEGVTKKYYHFAIIPSNAPANDIENLTITHHFTENGLSVVRELKAGAQFNVEFIYRKHVAGSYVTLSALTAAAPSTTDAYYVTSEGKVYHNPGTGWVPMQVQVALVFDKNIKVDATEHVFKYQNKTIGSADLFANVPFTIARRRWWLTEDGAPSAKRLQNFQKASLVLKRSGVQLEEFSDYNFINNGQLSAVTIKITNNALFSTSAFSADYKLDVSAEQLYRDAVVTAQLSGEPEATYEVSFVYLREALNPGLDSDFNQNIDLKVGHIVRITDYDLQIKGLKGLVSSIDLNLDKPEESVITIQNYKTRFEDLFERIIASSEQMKTSGYLYDRVVNAFAPNMSLSESVIQNTFNSSDFIIAPGGPGSSVEFGPRGFITETPYILPTGVTGQTWITGGNILLSDSVDANGNRIWATAISPLGVSASVLHSGRIDTERVNIYSGEQLRFAWKADGIFAYKDNPLGTSYNHYVRYNEDGLLFLDNGVRAVELGWEGLYIGSQGGSVELTAREGLEIYDGSNPRKLLIKLGGFGLPNLNGVYPDYGMKFYRTVDGVHIETLVSTNEGELWLRDSLMIGAHGSNNFVGITGRGLWSDTEDPIRIWAGSETPDAAPFYITHSGALRATKADIHGSITALDGKIGNWLINNADTDNGQLVSLSGQVGLSSSGTVIWSGGQPPGPGWQSTIDYLPGDIVFWEGNNYISLAPSTNIYPNAPVEPGEEPKWGLAPQTVANFFVDESGRLHANNAVISGNVTATAVMAIEGQIGGWHILPTSLVNVAGSTGMASSGGEFVFWAGGQADEKPLFSVTHYGHLFAQSAEISGIMYANRGFIGDLLAIGGGEFWSEEIEYSEGDIVFYNGYTYKSLLEQSGNTPENLETWSVVDPYSYISGDVNSTSYALKIADNFSVGHDGKVTATDGRFLGEVTATAGKIGGWTVAESALISDNNLVSIDSLNQYAVRVVDEDNEVQFYLTNEGVLFTKKADIEGKITATSGAITGKLNIGLSEYSYISTDPEEHALKIGDNFYVSHDGSMYAANANVEGDIVANKGYIGGPTGWIIETGLLTTSARDVGLHAKGTDYVIGEARIPIRIWAGTYNEDNPIDTPFLVLSDGTLHSSKANIRGAIVAESGYIKDTFRIGDVGEGILMHVNRDAEDNYLSSFIGSSQFTGGSAGYGWQIRSEGSATFENVQVRGKIKSTVFEYNRISAVGGSLYVAPTIHCIEYSEPVIRELDGDNNPTGRLIIVVPNTFTTANIGGRTWTVGDQVIYEFSAVLNSELVDFTNMNGEIIEIDDTTIILQINEAEIENSNWREALPGKRVNPGALIIFYGKANNRQAIYLTALSDEGGPFIDVVDNNLDIPGEEKPEPKVRLGRLDGIIDDYFLEKELTGYGLYSQNAYLRGQLMLPGAGVTNQGDIKYSYENDAPNRPIYDVDNMTPSELNSPIRMWAGLPEHTTDIKEARFIVTESGFLYANAGVFSGVVKATDGIFSGIIKAAGIVIDNARTPSAESQYNHFFVGYKKEPLTPNDYVLDIDSNGLTIWEGGLRAYSDWDSGWRDEDVDEPSGDVLAPYGYGELNKKPFPYFALADDDQISRLTTRALHIVDITRNSSQSHAYYSIKSKEGKLYFDRGLDEQLINPEYSMIESKIAKITTKHYIGVTPLDSQSILELSGDGYGIALNMHNPTTVFVGSSPDEICGEDIPKKTLNVKGTVYVYGIGPEGKGAASFGGAEVQEAKDISGNTIGINIIV